LNSDRHINNIIAPPSPAQIFCLQRRKSGRRFFSLSLKISTKSINKD